MNILTASAKGGVGKSTIATNLATYLAHEGADVMLLDADLQATSKRWADRRNERTDSLPTVHCVQARGDVFKPLKDLSGRFQHIVCDVGGYDSREMRTAMVAADVLILPTKCSQPDLETMDHMHELIALARGLNPELKAYALLSIAPANPLMNEVQEARAFMSDFPELELLDVVIRDRRAYRDAILEGMGVVELNNTQARAEIQLLGQAIFSKESV